MNSVQPAPKWILFALSILFVMLQAATCTKEKEQEPEQQGSKITVLELIDGNGKIWWISEVTLTYTSAAGGVDSIVKPPFRNLETSMWFGPSAYGSIKYEFMAGAPLDTYIPETGSWELNIPAQTIYLKCFDVRGTCSTAKDGTWKIERYRQSPYGESFNLVREYLLPTGRKMKVWARLYND